MWCVRRKVYYKTNSEGKRYRGNYPVSIVQWRSHKEADWRSEERQVVARRYAPFFLDEHTPKDGSKVYWRLPRWAPCNALLHHWRTHEDAQMHDHQRWSITIVLRGELTEFTPWGERRLRAGSVVLRSRRYIHGFRCERQHSARTWTLFIVGRRVGVQNTFEVKRQFERPNRGAC